MFAFDMWSMWVSFGLSVSSSDIGLCVASSPLVCLQSGMLARTEGVVLPRPPWKRVNVPVRFVLLVSIFVV